MRKDDRMRVLIVEDEEMLANATAEGRQRNRRVDIVVLDRP